MIGKDLLGVVMSGRGGQALAALYGREDGVAAQEQRRYASLIEAMISEADFPADRFPEAAGDLRVFSAPGRTELGGNHTDHNRGRVLAASIQMDAVAVVAPRADKRVFFRSTGFPDVSIDLARDGEAGASGGAAEVAWELSPKPEEVGTTEALIRGIAAEFVRQGTEVGGFSANAASTVLQGSGLSSSAALEVLVAKIFDCLYGGGKRGALELAQIGQRAENVFFGKPSGLMDQAACAYGGTAAIDFADPAAPVIKTIGFDPLSAGFVLCVVNTRGSHADLTQDYAAIPHEMNAVARCLGKSFLREVDLAAVLCHAVEIRKAAGDRALLRAIHFCNEDRRVAEMVEVLERLDAAPGEEQKREAMARYLELVNESGDSSWELLQNMYSPRNPSGQALSVALALTREFFREHGASGACRVHGGGFAGTIQAYVPVKLFERYLNYMDAVFGSGAVTPLRIRPVGAVEIIF